MTGADAASPRRATDSALSRHLMEVAAQAAQAVAGDLRAAFRADMAVAFKRDEHDPVTEHDRRAEARIREEILTRVPDSAIIGEEAGAQGSGTVQWFVDPIDGTANFARGLAFFCTSIGAVLDGRVLAGAVLDPIAGNLFTACDDGAYVNGERLAPAAGAGSEARGLLITSYPSSRDVARDGAGPAGDRLIRLIGAFSTVRRCGSAALTLAHVAAGWADAALGIGINAWDVCAGQLMVIRSGGHYQPLGGAGWDSPGYLAHGSSLRPAVLAEVAGELAGELAAVPPGDEAAGSAE